MLAASDDIVTTSAARPASISASVWRLRRRSVDGGSGLNSRSCWPAVLCGRPRFLGGGPSHCRVISFQTGFGMFSPKVTQETFPECYDSAYDYGRGRSTAGVRDDGWVGRPPRAGTPVKSRNKNSRAKVSSKNFSRDLGVGGLCTRRSQRLYLP